MNLAQLAHPEWWRLVATLWLGVAAAVGVARWIAQRRFRALMGGAVPGSAVTQRAGATHSDALLLLALVAIGVALLGPRIGERAVETTSSGIDTVILLDVSQSMDAQDNPPSRLDRARRGIGEVLDHLQPSDRVALAVFAGVGVVLTPLTPDHAALAELVDAVDTRLITPASSGLAGGVEAAVTAFETGSARPRTLLLVSDGEESPRASDVGIASARAANARVVAVALGSELGAAVPDYGVPLRDLAGQMVISRRDTPRLRELVDATGGALFEADEWGVFDFAGAAAALRLDAGGAPGQRVERHVPAVRVAPFAALAFALLLVEGLPRWRRRPSALAAAVVAAFALGAAEPDDPHHSASPEPSPADGPSVAAVEAFTRVAPRDPDLLDALGRARLEAADPDGAARAFAAAAAYGKNPDAIARAHYALGVAEIERGELAAARDAFFDALAFDPFDEQARFNLEWTLVALAERPPEPYPPDEIPEPSPDSNAPEDERNASTDEPDAEPPAEREPEPEPTRELTDEQIERALGRVRDDLERAVRASVREQGAATGRRPRGPVW